jgi:hypothetical protein
MIPENTLAVGPALRWLGLAMSVLFVLSVLFVYRGGALWRRLRRKALERSLDKIKWHKLVAAILLSFSLLTSQMAFGQTAAPAPKLTRTEQYQKLMTVTNRIMVQLKKTCKTEQCAALSDEGVALVADAQPKAAKGWLVEEERLDFHNKLDSLFTRVIAAIQASKKTPETSKLKLPDGAACRAKNVVFDQDRCDQCYEVFETLAEICALYLGICETCALICLSTATLQFGHCLKEFCGGT